MLLTVYSLLLGLLYPSTVVLPPICVICPCLLIAEAPWKLKPCYLPLYAHNLAYRAHTRCSINGCWIEISSWFPCSIQGAQTGGTGGGEGTGKNTRQPRANPWKFPQSPPPSLILRTQAKQRAVHRCGVGRKQDFSSSPPFFNLVSSSANKGIDRL